MPAPIVLWPLRRENPNMPERPVMPTSVPGVPTQEWPVADATRYRDAGYWQGESIGAWLRARAAQHAERTAVVGGSTRWSYARLDQEADRVAAGFLARGVQPGERVVVQLPNVPEFLAVMLGLIRAGIVPVFALPAHRQTEIDNIATVSGAVAYVIPAVHEKFDYRTLGRSLRASHATVRHVVVAGVVEQDDPDLESLDAFRGDDLSLLIDPPSSSVAFLQLSGGSTGLSKLIPRTHDDYLYSVRESATICGLSPASVYLVVLPVAHNFPMSSPGFLGALDAGACIVLSPSPAPDVAFALIEQERVTIAAAVPPIALMWLEAKAITSADLSSLEVLQVGGAKLTPAIAARVTPTLGATLQQVFGMAEGLVNYTRLDDDVDTICNTQGRPISADDELRIVDDDDVPVAPGAIGHLQTRGPYTIRGYYQNAAANARSFTDDGFYRTGDLVSRTAAGYLVVHGRATDQINRGGEKVSPEEVEDHLVAHPAVLDAVVVSVPDDYLGERSCAFVIPRAERVPPPVLKSWIRNRGLAAYKVPDQIVFVDAFPSTGVGKTSRKDLRGALRALAAEQATAAAAPVSTPDSRVS